MVDDYVVKSVLLLESLTYMQLLCLSMKFFDLKKYREIAEELNIEITSVQSHIDRGKQKIKDVGLSIRDFKQGDRPKMMLTDDLDTLDWKQIW